MRIPKNLPNGITLARIGLALLLIFLPAFSLPFYGAYLLGGLSDMADGFLARKFGCTGEWGAKLDSLADFCFLAVCLAKCLPQLSFSTLYWVWGGGICLLKAANAGISLAKHHRLPAEHTRLNRITGLALFLFLFTIRIIPTDYTLFGLCALATAAAVAEGVGLIRKNRRNAIPSIKGE